MATENSLFVDLLESFNIAEAKPIDCFERLQTSNPDIDEVFDLAVLVRNIFTIGISRPIGGLMVRTTNRVEELLAICEWESDVENGLDHYETCVQMLRTFVKDLIDDPPVRFVEMLRWDAAYMCQTELSWVLDIRREADLLARRPEVERLLSQLQGQLIISTPPRTTERYCLDLENYQENEEERQRFVLRYILQ